MHVVIERSTAPEDKKTETIINNYTTVYIEHR